MRSTRLRLIAIGIVLIVGVAVTVWAATATKLYINGQVASTNLRIIDGHSYVPVVDVAKALGATIQRRDDGYDLVTPGGANQVEGAAQGKIGELLHAGDWRFEVVSVENAGPQYKERYYQELRTIKAQGPGDTLLVVNCRLKNATKKTQTPLLTEREPGNTALADTGDHSYPPLDYDARQESDKTQSYAAAALLPGAAADFALVFSVPQGTQPKALVYSLQAYPDDVLAKKHTNVRVDLTQKVQPQQ